MFDVTSTAGGSWSSDPSEWDDEDVFYRSIEMISKEAPEWIPVLRELRFDETIEPGFICFTTPARYFRKLEHREMEDGGPSIPQRIANLMECDVTMFIEEED